MYGEKNAKSLKHNLKFYLKSNLKLIFLEASITFSILGFSLFSNMESLQMAWQDKNAAFLIGVKLNKKNKIQFHYAKLIFGIRLCKNLHISNRKKRNADNGWVNSCRIELMRNKKKVTNDMSVISMFDICI